MGWPNGFFEQGDAWRGGHAHRRHVLGVLGHVRKVPHGWLRGGPRVGCVRAAVLCVVAVPGGGRGRAGGPQAARGACARGLPQLEDAGARGRDGRVHDGEFGVLHRDREGHELRDGDGAADARACRAHGLQLHAQAARPQASRARGPFPGARRHVPHRDGRRPHAPGHAGGGPCVGPGDVRHLRAVQRRAGGAAPDDLSGGGARP